MSADASLSSARGTDVALRTSVRDMMERHWRPELGWSVPNGNIYPWLWSWDSAFHSLIWDALGDPRAVTELAGIFAAQTDSGFIPHINYAADPAAFESFWGVGGASTLIQPPMYGHALGVLGRRGRNIEALIEPALRGMRRLFKQRRAPCGLLRIFHPWESGIDDHPRWAAWQPHPWRRSEWYVTKGRLVEALIVEDREAVGSPAFDVCSAGFNALAVWNSRQLAAVAGDDELRRAGDAVAVRLDKQWNAELCTWVDAAPDGGSGSSVRTLDALLPALVTSDPSRVESALDAALDPGAFGLPFGPTGVHIDEPSFVPDAYGRGGAWAHLAYLLWAAAEQSADRRRALLLARMLVGGAKQSGLAEYWDPRDGTGLGASPHGWSGLAIAVGVR